MTFNDGALRVIQEPEEMEIITNEEYALKLVHRLSTAHTVYVHVGTSEAKKETFMYVVNGIVKYVNLDSTVIDIKSIGDTLIINTTDGLKYCIWNESYDKYDSFDKLPELDIEFTSMGVFHAQTTLNSDGIIYYGGEGTDYVIKGKEEDFNSMVRAGYAKVKNDIAKDKAFCNPYFVRAAYELSNGTYYYITNPILMLPIFRQESIFLVWSTMNTDTYAYGMQLCYKINNTDLAMWKDIIKGVVIFASKEVDTHDLTKTPIFQRHEKTSDDMLVGRSMCSYHTRNSDIFDGELKGVKYIEYVNNDPHAADTTVPPYPCRGKYYSCIAAKTEDDIIEELKDISVFYKLCRIPIDGKTSSWISTAKYIKDGVVENLLTQTTIQTEDYFSRCPLVPSGIEVINGRMNIYSVERGFFEGFKYFLNHKSSETQTAFETEYAIVVYIKSRNLDERIIVNRFSTEDIIDHYFYYPDPRAYKAEIYMLSFGKWYLRKTMQLQECVGLNGAIYLDSLPLDSDNNTTINPEWESTFILPTAVTTAESLGNQVIQSNVHSPWQIYASGYVRVGQGEIIGMAALTTALSQDVYKVATTIVFTTQGIWALEIDSTGVYKQVTPPFSREVCSNPKSITMVDNGVFFVSKKGLMLIDDNGVRCVSEQLSGINNHNTDSFQEFLDGCECAYDYRDSQLWLINSTKDEQGNAKFPYHWIYNMKSGTFSRMDNGVMYTSIVGDYPDTLLQGSKTNVGSEIYSLINKPNINNDKRRYGGQLITRPIHLDAPTTLKSLRQIEPLAYCHNAECTIIVFASNNLKDWTELHTIKGEEFKFYKLYIDLQRAAATTTYTGEVMSFQLRQDYELK